MLVPFLTIAVGLRIFLPSISQYGGLRRRKKNQMRRFYKGWGNGEIRGRRRFRGERELNKVGFMKVTVICHVGWLPASLGNLPVRCTKN